MQTNSEDQKRRASPKISVTIEQKNHDFLKNVFIPANPKYGDVSKAVNRCITAVRRAFEDDNGEKA